MKQINSNASFSGARNAEHYQIHSDLLATITTDVVTTLGIPQLRETYAALFDTENDCYLRNAAYRETPDVEAADRERDGIHLYLVQTISAALHSPVAATRDAARRLSYVIDPYRNAARLGYAANTAAVSDLVLKLADAVTALDQANRRFNTIYTGRSDQLLTRSTSDTMKTIRPRVDDAFRALASAINALYHTNALITRDAAREALLAPVIDRCNALILQLQTTLSRAGVGSHPSAPAPGHPTTDPTPGGDSGNGGEGGNPGGDSGEGEDVLS